MNHPEKLPSLLIVEDDSGIQKQLKWALSDHYQVELASDRANAMAIVRRMEPPVVILDLGLPPDPNGASEGLSILEEILSFRPATKVIVSSGNGERRHALEAIRLGAYDFYPKPVDIDVLRLIAQRALHLQALELENHRLAENQARSALPGLIAGSPVMLEVCRIAERVAPADVTVLLTGESGTGKEVLARALHEGSDRAARKFVAINCAAVPENLLESELFGHEKGAFTGAVKQTVGKFEQAHEGTLFLDEIGDMPLALQAKLLRFLQERVIERVGGRNAIAVDARVIAATNRNLGEMIAGGQFREDLFYRLSEIELHIPPLRERMGDAVLLARYFFQRFNSTLGRAVKGFAPDALAAISSYQWPGNVRELENRVKRALVLAAGDLISAANLGLSAGHFSPLREWRERADREAVTSALALSGNNVSAAAKLLGISRPTLYELMNSLSIRT
jgi:two-component system NtrC family response regulator